jgi:hypothetical protein
MDHVYTNFFSQFVEDKPKEYYVSRFSLFYLAYLEASKYFDMNNIKPSHRILKAIYMDDKEILYCTTIKRETENMCPRLFAANMVYAQQQPHFINELEEQIQTNIHIPPSVEYLSVMYPICKIPPTIKYLTIYNVTRSFTIDVELEYLYLSWIPSNELTTTKPIKFLIVPNSECLSMLPKITPYVKYIIFNHMKCICRNTLSNAGYPLNMLKCIFAHDICNQKKMNLVSCYTFEFLNNDYIWYIDCIKYLFSSDE